MSSHRFRLDTIRSRWNPWLSVLAASVANPSDLASQFKRRRRRGRPLFKPLCLPGERCCGGKRAEPRPFEPFHGVPALTRPATVSGRSRISVDMRKAELLELQATRRHLDCAPPSERGPRSGRTAGRRLSADDAPAIARQGWRKPRIRHDGPAADGWLHGIVLPRQPSQAGERTIPPIIAYRSARFVSPLSGIRAKHIRSEVAFLRPAVIAEQRRDQQTASLISCSRNASGWKLKQCGKGSLQAS